MDNVHKKIDGDDILVFSEKWLISFLGVPKEKFH